MLHMLVVSFCLTYVFWLLSFLAGMYQRLILSVDSFLDFYSLEKF
jgi:hypothetical protein